MALGLIAAGYQIGSSLIAGRKAKREADKVESEQRRRVHKISGMYDDLISRFTPGGTYGKSMFKGLRDRKSLSTGRSMQHLLRSGIGGTSFGDVQASYERQEGRQARSSLEDYLVDKRTGLEREKARFLEGINIEGPSFGDIASSYSGVGQGLAELIRRFDKAKGKKSLPELSSTPDMRP